MFNSYFIFILFCCFVIIINSQIPPTTTSSTLSVQQKFYKNQSSDYYVFPTTIGSQICAIGIPFQVSSTLYPIDSITFQLGLETIVPFNSYISEDSKDQVVVLYKNSIADTYYDGSIIVVENGYTYKYTFTIYCIGFDLYLNYEILNSCIYYNSLAFTIKFDSLPSEYNITLNFGSVDFRQYYLGNNQYFISTQGNNALLFTTNSAGNIILTMDFSATSIKLITIRSPYKYSSNIPEISYYSGIKSDSSYLVISKYNSIDNYFSAETDNNQSSRFSEPYLISSQNDQYNYLVPLSISQLNVTTKYSIFSYYQSSQKVVLSKIINGKVVVIPPMIDHYLPFSGFIEYGASYSSINIPITLNIQNLQLGYPFGLESAQSIITSLRFAIKTQIVIKADTNINVRVNDGAKQVLPIQRNSNDPISIYSALYSYRIDLIPNGKMILSFNFSSEATLQHITLYQEPNVQYKSMAYNQLKQDPLLDIDILPQVMLPRMRVYQIDIVTNEQGVRSYKVDPALYYSLGGSLSTFPSIENIDKVQLSDFNYSIGLKSVSFLHNDLVVTNRGLSNKMFIKLENYPLDREVKVTFIYSDYRANEKKDTVYSSFNQITGQFEFEFNIPKNIKTGNVSYTITLDSLDNINYFSYSLASEYQLRVLESNNIDLFGPVVTSLKMTSLIQFPKIQYSIEISDSANGFKRGYIIVRGSVDMTERNLTITPSNLYAGTSLKGAYFVELNYDNPCISQMFTIVYAYFEDTEGYSTEYDATKLSTKSPLYFFDNISVNGSCVVTFDGSDSSADLVDLKIPINSNFGPRKDSRIVSFNYTVYHPDGISTTSLPKVYITHTLARISESFETIVTFSNSTHTSLSSKVLCTIIDDGLVSIYGVVSKSGSNTGFSPSSISQKSLSNYFYFSSGLFFPIISGSSKLSSTGLGGLWLYGSYFELATFYQIQYTGENGVTGTYENILPLIKYPNAIYFSTIKATTKPVSIIVGQNSFSFGDPFTIYPVVYDFNPSLNSSSSDSSSTSLCFGSPVLCGGPLRGTCTSSGCKCISPWIGNDCMSRVIQVPPPAINETNPSTNITIGDDKDSTISSIISIVGIKELSIDSTELNRYYFEEWDYRMIFNDSYITRYSYSSYIKKDHIKVSNITVTLDWHKVESTIQFANEELHINPSTIKYTIKISSYPFSTQLSTLQLIMKASIQTDNKQSCSNKQFGESIQDDADYVKLQVNNYSFYGRFIKRCQIDNDQITKLSNTLLDSTMNDTITNDNEQTSQSYIGINIPQFQDNVIIDPDFSVLVDSSNNSNCKDNGNSGLTKSQLAGIIVGSVSLFIVLLIIISIIIYKSPGCLNTKIFIYKLIKNKN